MAIRVKLVRTEILAGRESVRLVKTVELSPLELVQMELPNGFIGLIADADGSQLSVVCRNEQWPMRLAEEFEAYLSRLESEGWEVEPC